MIAAIVCCRKLPVAKKKTPQVDEYSAAEAQTAARPSLVQPGAAAAAKNNNSTTLLGASRGAAAATAAKQTSKPKTNNVLNRI